MSRRKPDTPQQTPSRQTRACPKCGAAAYADDRFCGGCGTELPPAASLKCGSCHTELKKEDKFCFSCGAEVTKPKAKPRRRTAPVAKKTTAPKPKRQPKVQTPAPRAASRPSRWWPDTTPGRVILVAAVAFSLVAGLSIEPDQEGATVLLPLVLVALYLIWRNILISFGVIGPPAPAAPPGPENNAEQAENGKGGKAAKILSVVVILGVLVAAKACGKAIGRFFDYWW